MKRFTETTKWDDAWYRKLSPTAKLLWSYLTDKCNCVGLIDLDLEGAAFHIGSPVNESHLSEIGSRLQIIEGGKVFIPKFIDFQYGKLSPGCPAHKPVFKAIELYQLVRVPIGYQYPNNRDTVSHKRGKDKERKGKGVQGENQEDNSPLVALLYLNEKTGRKFQSSDTSLSPIRARLKMDGVTIEGIKTMIDRQCRRWMGTKFEEYLRPSTLFAPEKFNEYYAAKDLPINENETHKQNPPQRIDRSKGTANEGTSVQYRGLGKVAATGNP